LYPIYWRGADRQKWIRRGDMVNYFDDTFASAVMLWKSWKTFGLPHDSGPLAERLIVITLITTVEDERKLYESRKAEEARDGNSRRAKGGGSGRG
jgi:hypothetical protein